MMIMPSIFLNITCLMISVAASRLVARAVSSMFLPDVALAEFTSMIAPASKMPNDNLAPELSVISRCVSNSI